jgi:hypothetical protein
MATDIVADTAAATNTGANTIIDITKSPSDNRTYNTFLYKFSRKYHLRKYLYNE